MGSPRSGGQSFQLSRCNRIKRQHGKDGFFVTNSTVVCSKLFRKEDVRKSLRGRWFLVPGLCFSICFCLTPNANVLYSFKLW